MGATYTRQSTYSDGDVITAAHTNDEFNQLLAAFAASTGHTHDGTAAEGGPITKLLGNTLTFGAGTAGTDITVTFDGETNDGVLKWMEDEDYFEFSDDILVASTEKLQFRDTAIYINSSTDGQLDLVADTEIQLAATTVDLNGNLDVSGSLTLGGTAITSTAAELNILDGVTSTASELNILDGVTATTAELNIMDGVTATTAELNIMDGVTATTAELNTMDGVTSTTAELNLVDGASAGTIVNSKSVIYGSSGEVNATTLQIAGTSITSTATELNLLDGVTATTSELNILDGVTATASELNLVDGITAGTVSASKAVIVDSNKDISGFRNVTITGDLTVSGDDITMGTNTSGHIMVADGTNFNPVAVSGDVTISSAGAVTIANDAVETAMVNANVITGQTAETSLDTSNDTILIHDASASSLKKTTLASISSALGGITDVVADTSPQLGGDLDVNGNGIVSTSNGNIALTPNGSGVVRLDGNVDIQSGLIDLKNSGSRSQIKFYCESGNAHAQTLQAAPHSESASNTLTLPSTGGDVDLVSTASTATLTNKTLTSPKINEDVALTATATELNLLDGVSGLVQADFTKLAAVDSTSTELNLVDGSSAGTIVNSKAVIYGSSGEVNATTLQIAGTSITSTATELNLLDGVSGLVQADFTKLAAVDATATELNIMDGGTSASSTTLVDADRIVTNDDGTMKQVALTDVKTYLTSAGFSTEDPTALAIALG